MTVTAIGQVNEACMCKRFGSTLTGPALRWFVGLPNRSISTFADLVNAFTQQFASSRKPQKHAGDLYRIVQGAGKTIGEYNTRFNNEKVAVRECDVSTAVEAFRRGLHHETGLYKLTMHPYHSFEAVQEKAAAAIRLEEDTLARASIPSTPSISSTSAMEKSSRKQSTSKKDERYSPYGRGVSRVDNREENQQLPTLAKHATETKGDRPETSCRISHSDLHAVNFHEGDVGDEQEHHDALIITLSMANCTVRKVLVDTGSSVNLVMLKTRENMRFSEKDLQKKTVPQCCSSEISSDGQGRNQQ
ncbi:uncharacterized protein LOC141641046 [Silene latifolia]|uniref:uncharacterized protein LOC141641046 n=1 Tax=Silene latifolia TaxID=37657 RepID=UPI003D777FC4